MSSAGDVDGGGLDDLLISAEAASGGGSNSGETYLILSSELETLDAADGSNDNVIDLANAQGVPPCFAPGALIRTERGDVPVEALKLGDKVITADRGPQPLR